MRERGREGLLPVPSCACGIDIGPDIGAEAAEAVVVEEPKPKRRKVKGRPRHAAARNRNPCEVLSKGMLTSRSIDFVFRNN
jgi:hypothetical protein